MENADSSIFSLYGKLLEEWCMAAFASATLDWIASKIPVRNGIFATLLSIGQLTCAFVLTNSLLGIFKSGSNRLLSFSDNWLSYNTIIIMSPTAVNRLTNSYKKLHMILYGPARIPQPPSCPSGNCGTSDVVVGSNQKALPQREKAVAIERTMNERIANQWKEMKTNK